MWPIESYPDLPQVNWFLVETYRGCFPDWTETIEGGLLCREGNLSPECLLAAYSSGIFPWFVESSPILWWHTNPRCIMPLEDFHLPKRSLRTIKHQNFTLTLDQAFEQVIKGCAAPRESDIGTWIVGDMPKAYIALHKLGYAHSIETWQDGKLVGGLYGVALGDAFFGESMFHRVSEASRWALAGLVELLKLRKCKVLDCQQETPHMVRMGAKLISGRSFQALLKKAGVGQKNLISASAWKPWSEDYIWSAESSSWRSKSK